MDKKKRLDPDILPSQIVEDEDGVMHILPEEYLIEDVRQNVNPMREGDLAKENMDNDMPCSDMMDE